MGVIVKPNKLELSRFSRGQSKIPAAAGGFLPTDLSGLDVWLKADAITGLSDSDPVTSWVDSSGNSNTASALSDSPVYHASAINSLPAVEFGIGTDHLTFGSNILSTQVTWFLVAYRVGGAVFQGLFVTDAHSIYASWTGSNWGHYPGGSTFVDSLDDISTDYKIIASTSDGYDPVATYSEGVLTNTGASDGIASRGTSAIGGDPGGTQPFFGFIAEVVAYNRILSGAEIAQVGGYLSSKYALTW